jgi:hypothetical protein
MAEENQNEQQQSAEQPTEQQQSSEQTPEQTDQVKEGIMKAVSKNMGGKRERATKRLSDSQKAQQATLALRIRYATKDRIRVVQPYTQVPSPLSLPRLMGLFHTLSPLGKRARGWNQGD